MLSFWSEKWSTYKKIPCLQPSHPDRLQLLTACSPISRPCRLPGPRALGIYGISFRIYPKFRGKSPDFPLKSRFLGSRAETFLSMPKISRFFGYWRKKHRFIPKNSIYTMYRYVQNKLSSLAACLPLNPSPGSGRQLPQSTLETARSCTQYPAGIPVKDGFSML